MPVFAGTLSDKENVMSRGLVGLLLISVLVAIVPATRAQMTAVTNSTSAPIPGAGHDYIKMLSETVDPANGSLSLRLQVPVPPGRALTIPFSFSYDSNGVHFVANGPQPGDGGWDTIRNTDTSGLQIALGGWSYSVPTLSYQTLQFTQGAGGPSPCDYTATGGFVFTDATGGRHSLNLGHAYQPQPLTCAPHFTESDSAGDPYYQAELVGGLSPVIVSSDGTVYKFQNSGAVGAGIVEVLPTTSIEDRNGNIATANTDTLARNSVSWSGRLRSCER